MSTQLLFLQLVNGLTIGAIYALIALGYTMVYGILLMINFAHGEIFMVGSYAGFLTLTYLHGFSEIPIPLKIMAGFLTAMVTALLLGVLVERVAYRPLRYAPRLAPLISAIGTSIFIQNAVMILSGARIKIYPDTFPVGYISLGTVGISYIRTFIILTSILLMIALYLFVQKTKVGKAMRAVAEDKEAASLMGININKIITTTFILGSLLAGAGGIMVGMYYTQINHMLGFVPGIKAFTAAVLGGIGNIPGAMVGGFFLGLAEVLATQFMPAVYKDVVAFSLLVVILIFRPRGILGEVIAKKV
ncbi:MAG: branched-chain amino acid ABC transporter permease [Candidatus Tectomicrobia bacterium]|uniref:Branched-chain amino acid ABC transporter permease n=1 Tax=Tectimicrobiota bacterium TaxID=2528274 RepID=A0A933LQ76_UNCTE|nr:branched-chain amino acid ABC transporter permease [Candidatus Tectomicrobia bacterium]